MFAEIVTITEVDFVTADEIVTADVNKENGMYVYTGEFIRHHHRMSNCVVEVLQQTSAVIYIPVSDT